MAGSPPSNWAHGGQPLVVRAPPIVSIPLGIILSVPMGSIVPNSLTSEVLRPRPVSPLALVLMTKPA